MSTQQSFIGAILSEPDTLSVWTGIVMTALGVINHALGTETIGLLIVVCGMLLTMAGVAEKAASEAIEQARITEAEE